MITECVSNTNFEGKLIILNGLSHKPYSCIKKVENNLKKQIQPKDFDLFVEQDYRTNKINIAASSLRLRFIHGVIIHEELPITAKSSRYIYAAKNAIDKYENAVKENEQKEWEQSQKQRKMEILKDTVETIFLFPLFAVNDILHSINPKWSKNFEKRVIDRII